MDSAELKGKTVAELKDQAKSLGISGISSMKKDELIDAIASQSGGEGETKTGGKKPAVSTKSPTDKTEIKKRIRALKAEKADAVSAQDKTRAKACNRQIHDLKRMLRKMAGGA